jgi:hypothetical protein
MRPRFGGRVERLLAGIPKGSHLPRQTPKQEKNVKTCHVFPFKFAISSCCESGGSLEEKTKTKRKLIVPRRESLLISIDHE